jgi:type IV secretion system protein VirB10
MANHNENLPAEDLQDDGADRGMPSISRKGKGGGVGQKLVLIVIGILTVLALIAVNGGFSGKDGNQESTAQASTSKEIGNRLGPAPAPPPPPAMAEQENTPEKTLDTGQIGRTAPANREKEVTPEQRKRSEGLVMLVRKNNSNHKDGMTAAEQAQMATATAGNSLDGADRADGLGANLKPTNVDGTRASVLTDPNMFITRGTYLDCALETAISSDQPGMTSCRMTRDVYSTNGKVLLLDRGSRITGQYQSGMKRGQARIFVLWTRIETPNGVIVNLDSPGTDALGRSGHTGYVDTHFWARFGAAIMFSLLDDVGNYVSNLARNDDGDTINFGSTSETATDMAGVALENSINIPPTLLKNQGEHINVFVARDLDFRGVYDLKTSR